jgi:hypothetical protein
VDGLGGGGVCIGIIVAYLLTEIDLGTGGGHFESIDSPLKLEAAPMLSLRLRGCLQSCKNVPKVLCSTANNN